MPDDADLRPELQALWRAVVTDLRRSMPPSTVELWIEPLRPVGTRGGRLQLTGPPTARTWVERRYAPLIEAALARIGAATERVELVGDARTSSAGDGAPTALALDGSLAFDRFVIGPGNRLAHAACLAVAELPGEAYNPLFLHGPPGLGKTHLMSAIANYMARAHPGLTVHLTTAERFTSEFVRALRTSGPDAFKRRYRTLDALLIDDVQVLEGKEHTEEEFVHTFNELYSAGKQIVLSSDRPPEALARLAERLRDRFAWGLTVPLEPPDLRTRMALLARIAAQASIDTVDASALREIALRVPGNVRLLEGAMTRVLAVASLDRERVSPELVRRALAGDERRDPDPSAAPLSSRSTGIGDVQRVVAEVFGVAFEALPAAGRTEPVVRARQLAMYLSRELTSESLAGIARAFNRDHSTVLHAIRAVEGRLDPGSSTTEALGRARAMLGAQAIHDPQPLSPPSSTA